MPKKSDITILKQTFWRAFSLTALLWVVSQKIDQLRIRNFKRTKIVHSTPLFPYWDHNWDINPEAYAEYQTFDPWPFQQISSMEYDQLFPNSFSDIDRISFNQEKTKSDVEKYNPIKPFSPPPNWKLLYGKKDLVMMRYYVPLGACSMKVTSFG